MSGGYCIRQHSLSLPKTLLFSVVPAITDEKPDADTNMFLHSKAACFPLEAFSLLIFNVPEFQFAYLWIVLHSCVVPYKGCFNIDGSCLSFVENCSITDCFDFIIPSSLFFLEFLLAIFGPPLVT